MTELVRNRLTTARRLLVAVALACLVGGSLSAQTIGGVTDRGAITQWLLLGPYDDGAVGCNFPTVNTDWLTDGTIIGDEWEPQAGDSVDTDCGGAAGCVSWLCNYASIGDPSINCADPNAAPRVAYYDSPEPRGYIDLNNFYSGQNTMGGNGGTGNPENVLAYAWTYVINNTGADLNVRIGHNSDDSWRILVNHVEVQPGTIACRPPDPDTYDQDTVGPVVLKDGRNVIMTQTTDGCCNWGFRIRLIDDETGSPLQTPDIEIQTAPPFYVVRDLPDVMSGGDTVPVTIDIQNAGPIPNNVEIREGIPLFWTAENPSPPGTVETDVATGRQTVVWKLTGGVDSQTLSYDLNVPDPFANVTFLKSFGNADGTTFGIFGDRTVTGGRPGTAPEALIVRMKQPTTGCAGNNPGAAALAQDYLTDGDEVSEQVVAPVAGDSISPDFGGASPSPGPTSAGDLTWTRLPSAPAAPADGWFQLDACDDCMAYVASYVVNRTNQTFKVRIGSSSDDGEQILVDGKEVWNNSVARGAGTASPQDHTPLFDLTPGKHLILQKVFEGCGGFDSSFRLEDEDSNPVVMFPFTLDPSADKPAAGDPAYQAGRAFVMRRLPSGLDVGETGTISLKMRIKQPPIVGGTIEENVPDGWTISNVTGGGVRTGQKITWALAGNLTDTDFTYQVAVPADAVDAAFAGTVNLGGLEGTISGEQTFNRGIMNASGFIKHWLVLGPLDTSGIWNGDQVNFPTDPVNGPSACPENGDIRLDYLRDAAGAVTESTIRPFNGMRLNIDFGNSAKSAALETLARACAPAVPTWERFIAPASTVDNNAYFGEDINSHTTYAATYITNTTGSPIATNVAFNSDDAFIVFLDGNELGAYEPAPCSSLACGRGYGGENTVADIFPVTIEPGEHFLLTRVHDGGGGSGHRLRFQDGAGNPLLPPGLSVSTSSTKSPPAAFVRRILSGESYRVGGAPLTVTLRADTTGAHNLSIREVVPTGFTAANISDGGVSAGGQITWTLNGVNGTRSVKYDVVPGDCPGDGSWCGNGPDASEYTVDGSVTHALKGDESFKRDTSGTDDLGPWDIRDIGTSGGATQRVGDHAADVTGKGGGVKLTKDEFRFISIPASGDFSISTRIDCLDDSSGTGQGGLMVRDTYDTFSAHAFFSLSSTPPAGGGVGTLKGILRKDTKKTQTSSPITITNAADREVLALPVWLRITRTGIKISLQRSDNGKDYREVATRDIGTANATPPQINLKNDTLIGMAVSGTGGTARVDYRDVSGPAFTPEVPNAPTLTSATGGAKQVALAWTAPASGPAPTAFTIHRGSAGGPYVKVGEVVATQTTFTNTGLSDATTYCYVVRSKRGSSESANSTERCATTTGGGGFRRADSDGNGLVELTDAIFVLNNQFLGGPDPGCMDAADADDSGAYDLTDAIFSLQFQFLGGPNPPAPGVQNCGPDPSNDGFPACVYNCQ